MRLGGNEDGYAAVLALFFVAIVATLTVSMTRSTSTEFQIASNDVGTVRIREALASGVDLAVFEISQQTARRSSWAGRLSIARDIGTAHVEVEVTDEAAFVDLNGSDPALILGALSRSITDPEGNAAPFGWNGVGGPDADRLAATLRQRTTPFQTISEVRDALGLTPAQLRHLERVATTFSVDGRINPQAADREVLGLLPGVQQEGVDAVVQAQSDGTSGDPATTARIFSALPSAAPLLRQDAGPIFRVTVTAEAGPYRGHLEATVWVAADRARPYRVLSWHENW